MVDVWQCMERNGTDKTGSRNRWSLIGFSVDFLVAPLVFCSNFFWTSASVWWAEVRKNDSTSSSAFRCLVLRWPNKRSIGSSVNLYLLCCHGVKFSSASSPRIYIKICKVRGTVRWPAKIQELWNSSQLLIPDLSRTTNTIKYISYRCQNSKLHTWRNHNIL